MTTTPHHTLKHEGLIMRRDEGRAVVNVSQSIVSHSPDGFEFGYGGSGPADLALNVVYYLTGDKKLAEKLHQEFKFTFIAKVPREGGTIAYNDMMNWIHEKTKHNV